VLPVSSSKDLDQAAGGLTDLHGKSVLHKVAHFIEVKRVKSENYCLLRVLDVGKKQAVDGV
jgi:hypothetical protein